MSKYQRDWKEDWIDTMGLIVACSGADRFSRLSNFKALMKLLPENQQLELKESIRRRFTPTNGQDGCVSGTTAVKEATS